MVLDGFIVVFWNGEGNVVVGVFYFVVFFYCFGVGCVLEGVVVYELWYGGVVVCGVDVDVEVWVFFY